MSTYPWNAPRSREVVIRSHEAGVKRHDLESMGKHLSCQMKAMQAKQEKQFKCAAKLARCNERKTLRKLREIELLEVLRRRGRGGGRRDELAEVLLLGGLNGEDGGDDNTALLALLLEEERRGGHGGRHDDVELMLLNNRVNKLASNVTQLDTILGVRPLPTGTTA